MQATYKEMVKPCGFDTNYNILAMKDGKQFDFSVEVRDLKGMPDCKIGDFANNIWFRPKPALKDTWEGYKGYSELSKAVKLCLIKKGFTILGWYKRER